MTSLYKRRLFLSATTGTLAAIATDSLFSFAQARPRRTSAEQAAWQAGELLYENPLASAADVKDFRLEGPGVLSFPRGRMRMESAVDVDVANPKDEQTANFVHWCSETFPADIEISWDFWPVREPGLCILFFAAAGRHGEDLFDESLAKRSGPYPQYMRGDINALHVSYFRRRAPVPGALQSCNLRKSHGFHLVASGPDPLPSAADASGPYRVRIVKYQSSVIFFIGDLLVFQWRDDGKKHGPVLGEGKIGFRQMAPLIAEYANLTVRAVEPRR